MGVCVALPSRCVCSTPRACTLIVPTLLSLAEIGDYSQCILMNGEPIYEICICSSLSPKLYWVWQTELLCQWWIHTVKQVSYNIISSGFKRNIFRASGFKSCTTSFKLSTVILSLWRPCSENKTDSNFKDYNVVNDSCLAMDEGTTEGGSWRGGFQSHFRAHIFSKSHFPVLKNIYPIPILTFFSHSQCPNPSPSALNLIFPGQQKANPSFYFTPSGPSLKRFSEF